MLNKDNEVVIFDDEGHPLNLEDEAGSVAEGVQLGKAQFHIPPTLGEVDEAVFASLNDHEISLHMMNDEIEDEFYQQPDDGEEFVNFLLDHDALYNTYLKSQKFQELEKFATSVPSDLIEIIVDYMY